jgi:RND family efflux transporter MFP subunit
MWWMYWGFCSMKKLLLAIPVLAAIVLSYGLGRHHSSGELHGNAGRRVLYWVDPMHPAYKSDKPGIAPDCGMQLEPVYSEDAVTPLPSQSLVQPTPLGSTFVDGNMRQLLGIRLASVQQGEGASVVRLVGRVVAEDTRVYKVDSGMEGFVQETHNDSEGTFVKKDQVLATYYGPESLSIASGFLAASKGVPGAAGKDGNRTIPFPGAVSKQGVSSIQGYRDRLRNLGVSDVQIKQIAENGQLPESIEIVSPVDGLILARDIAPGRHFERAAVFYEVVDLSRVWIIAEIFENEAQYFRPGAVARVTLPGQSKTLSARVTNILPQVDPATRTLKLRLEADNPGLVLRPDMFVDIGLAVSAGSGLTVPVDAVVDSGMAKRVFVDRGNGFFEPRTVETGWSFGDRVQITKGLEEGERVVSSGTFLVDSESRLKMVAAGAHTAPEESSHHEMTGQHSEEVMAGKAADPSCGMQVDIAHAIAEDNTASRGGKTYYFCSRDCKRKFEKSGESMAANQHGSDHD